MNTRKLGPVNLGPWHHLYRNFMDMMVFVDVERLSRCREEYLDHSADVIESFGCFFFTQQALKYSYM